MKKFHWIRLTRKELTPLQSSIQRGPRSHPQSRFVGLTRTMSRSALWRQEGAKKMREKEAEDLFSMAVEGGRVSWRCSIAWLLIKQNWSTSHHAVYWNVGISTLTICFFIQLLVIKIPFHRTILQRRCLSGDPMTRSISIRFFWKK